MCDLYYYLNKKQKRKSEIRKSPDRYLALAQNEAGCLISRCMCGKGAL